MWGSIFGLLSQGAKALATFLRLRERRENEDAGARKQREEDRKNADEVQEKMDAVEPSGKRDTVDRLRKNGF